MCDAKSFKDGQCCTNCVTSHTECKESPDFLHFRQAALVLAEIVPGETSGDAEFNKATKIILGRCNDVEKELQDRGPYLVKIVPTPTMPRVMISQTRLWSGIRQAIYVDQRCEEALHKSKGLSHSLALAEKGPAVSDLLLNEVVFDAT